MSVTATCVELGSRRALVVARLGRVGLHIFPAPILLIGLDGELRVRLAPKREWLTTREIYLCTNICHELDGQGGLVGVLYLTPGPYDDQLFHRRWDLPHCDHFELPGAEELREVCRAVYQSMISTSQLTARIEAILGGPEPTSWSPEPRVNAVMHQVQVQPMNPLQAIQRASDLSISASRLRHLVHECTGVSLQSFRRWIRMREVVRHVGAGLTLTHAAMESGFCSSAHLSRDFRAAFGLAPSGIIGVRTTTVRLHP